MTAPQEENRMNDTTVSRRRALQTGGLAAIAAGLLGTTTTASAQPSTAAPLVVGTTTNMRALVAEVEQQIELVRTHDRAVEVAQYVLYKTLTDEQKGLFRAYEEAGTRRDFEQMDLYVMDLGRHLPG